MLQVLILKLELQITSETLKWYLVKNLTSQTFKLQDAKDLNCFLLKPLLKTKLQQ